MEPLGRFTAGSRPGPSSSGRRSGSSTEVTADERPGGLPSRSGSSTSTGPFQVPYLLLGGAADEGPLHRRRSRGGRPADSPCGSSDRASPVCVYAGSYLDAEVLSHCPPDATLIDSSGLSLDEIVEHLIVAHQAGQDVARLCSGDPSLYSAVAEQARRLDQVGVPWDITPGVPAYAAAAAILGRELTVPELTQTVILTRTQAASTAMPEAESLERLAATRATIVLHLAIRRTRELAGRLASSTEATAPLPWSPGLQPASRCCGAPWPTSATRSRPPDSRWRR